MFVGLVNSARDPLDSYIMRFSTKKKKKPVARRCLNQLYPNAAKEYEAEYGLKVKLFLKPFFPFIFYDPRNYLQ